MSDIVNQFNKILIQFLEQVDKLYPDSQVKNYNNMISLSLKADKYIWINFFAEEAIKHNNEIMKKNEKYFFEGDIKFIKKLNLAYYYKISDKKTRENIWKYIQSLYLLSCSYKGYSKEILENVQKLSELNGDKNVTTESVLKNLKKMN